MPLTARRSKPDHGPAWLDDVEEAPRAGMEDVRRKNRMYAATRRILTLMPWMFAVLALMYLSTLPRLLEPAAAAPAAAAQIDSPTKAVAIQAVQNWLDADPSPLPGGKILSWDGAKVQADPAVTTNKDNGQSTEVQGLQLNTLTLTNGSGQIFTTTVQVGYSPIRGAQVIGAPTLIPRAPDDTQQWPNLSSWPGLTKVSATDPVTQAVTAWAKAYTSGDPNALRLAVGDTSTDHAYIPLAGATMHGVTVEDAATKTATADGSPAVTASDVVARVSFGITWQGQKIGRDATPSKVTYDVLITRADTASPQVVAWGGVGQGPDLSPFANAVTGRTITGPDTPTTAPTGPATTTAGS
ncbi:hypothetical protein V6N00_12835 [Tersicoccus sp. MR15.9]|uniref:hypothetical protein n=1 Tax=Tersicoccus mangrovi TaxID=3121635 RepID=UPI002FE5DE76